MNALSVHDCAFIYTGAVTPPTATISRAEITPSPFKSTWILFCIYVINFITIIMHLLMNCIIVHYGDNLHEPVKSAKVFKP